jgi:hypothetical protein
MNHGKPRVVRNNRSRRAVLQDMIVNDPETLETRPGLPLRMAEFDEASEARSVAEVLQSHLEDARAQLRYEQRLARRADRRVRDLSRAVEGWLDLIEDYERVTRTSVRDRRN